MEQSGPLNGALHVHTPVDMSRHTLPFHDKLDFEQTRKITFKLVYH